MYSTCKLVKYIALWATSSARNIRCKYLFSLEGHLLNFSNFQYNLNNIIPGTAKTPFQSSVLKLASATVSQTFAYDPCGESVIHQSNHLFSASQSSVNHCLTPYRPGGKLIPHSMSTGWETNLHSLPSWWETNSSLPGLVSPTALTPS